jgi:hypothetical protein
VWSVVLPKATFLFLLGLALGYNPAIEVLVLSSLLAVFVLGLVRGEQRMVLVLILGTIGLGTFVGVAFVFTAAPLSLSTLIRNSYDSIPAFFILTPALLARFRSNKIYVVVLTGILVFGGIGSTFYPSFLQSNLGYNYPFLSGNQDFLSLQYRTPYAQLRDYFLTLPLSQQIIVVGEATSHLNLSYNWRFTPGIGRLTNIQFYPYYSAMELRAHNLTRFYLYLEPGAADLTTKSNSFYLQIANGTLKSGSTEYPLRIDSVKVIFNSSSFYLAEVQLAFA